MSVIRAIRQLKLISKVLFTKKQTFLLKFQRRNVICSSDDESDHAEGGGENIVTTMREHTDELKTNINLCLNGYDHDNATNIDKRLVKGIANQHFSSDENNS